MTLCRSVGGLPQRLPARICHDPELGRGQGKKAARRIDADSLDWALSDFSGFIAADELYDGPFCILSIVDNRTFKRFAYQVLCHDPTKRDIEAFFRRFYAALQTRRLTLQGITTDGSELYPEPLATVLGDVPHQLCTFHVLRDLSKAVLSAVAKPRKALAAGAAKLPWGRPATRGAKQARAARSGSEELAANGRQPGALDFRRRGFTG